MHRNQPTPSLLVHVVAHTHWDREWYLPAGRFRQRLVALIDELLADPPESDGSFLLDGQAVILDDYLAVRPENRDPLGQHLRDGTLEAGPWYVLADELLPSAEALVRNLLEGRATLRDFGAEPPAVLYSPDAFGHPAALPVLAAGFGYPLIILWRGYGGPAWPGGDVFRWRASDGTAALVYHLSRDGYELGANLPGEMSAAAERWASIHDELAGRSTLGIALLPNGADHHARQPLLRESLVALARAAGAQAEVRRGSLGGFAQEVVRRSLGAALPEVGGMPGKWEGRELRDSYGYTWTLQGTFGVRAKLKRRNAAVERLFVRDMEPWVALAARRGSRVAVRRGALVRAAWKTLLLCHPHDTLCGCSVDEVARAMDVRLDDAEAQAIGLRDDALLDLAEHDASLARTQPESWQPVVLARNATARARGGVAELEVLRFRRHVRVGPGSAVTDDGSVDVIDDESVEAAPADRSSPDQPFVLLGGRVSYQIIERGIRHDLVESPVHYPHDDLVDSYRVVAWLEPVPGYGTTALTVDNTSDEVSVRSPYPVRYEPVTAGDNWLDNGLLRVQIDSAGTVRLDAPSHDASFESLIGFEDVADLGDLYTHSPSGRVLESATFGGCRLVHGGPLRGELRSSWLLDVPVESTRESRSTVTQPLELNVALTLDAGAPFLRVRVWGDNQSRDHRLRVVFRTGLEGSEVWADAAFGPVRRTPIARPASSAERPPATAPLARYVTLAAPQLGVTLYSDGLAEYEATAAGDIAVTLLRAVGELSRNDLPERPGHAGWPAATPEAQSMGRFDARFALCPHHRRDEATIAMVEQLADDVLLPLVGSTLRSALAVPQPTRGVELGMAGQAEDGVTGEDPCRLAFSACTESGDGDWLVLRCVNLTDRSLSGSWRLGFPVTEARLARLDEKPLSALPVDGREVRFEASPREVVTVLARG